MDYIAAIRHVCEVLNRHTVKYMIVGGTAVALHGYFRSSTTASGEITEKPDLDLWYKSDYENYFQLLKALRALGRDVSKYEDEIAADPRKSFFKFEFDDFTLDLLPEIKAPLKFNSSYAKRETVGLNNVEVPFICLDDLIEDKKASGRPKDINDVKNLDD